jgi:hypothetical protein
VPETEADTVLYFEARNPKGNHDSYGPHIFNAPHKSEVNKWTETQAEITEILMKHTAANKRQTKAEIKAVEAKLAALNRNH